MNKKIKFFILRIFTIVDRKNRLKWQLKIAQLKGMKIGNNTHIFSAIGGSEPYLIEIGENSTIATNVTFITHDASIGTLVGRDKYSDLVGKIVIGNNVFIGGNSVVLYGVNIGDNSIVAAGSVVTKSIPSNVVVGGNPAKILCTSLEFLEKSNGKMLSLHGKDYNSRKDIIDSSYEKYIERSLLKK